MEPLAQPWHQAEAFMPVGHVSFPALEWSQDTSAFYWRRKAAMAMRTSQGTVSPIHPPTSGSAAITMSMLTDGALELPWHQWDRFVFWFTSPLGMGSGAPMRLQILWDGGIGQFKIILGSQGTIFTTTRTPGSIIWHKTPSARHRTDFALELSIGLVKPNTNGPHPRLACEWNL